MTPRLPAAAGVGLVLAGLAALGLGFWRLLPSVVFLGAGLVIMGWALAEVGRRF